jgi:hypothetical protein
MTPPTGLVFRHRPLYKYTYWCIYVKQFLAGGRHFALPHRAAAALRAIS